MPPPLLAPPNRGLLLDTVVLAGNLLGVFLLEGLFHDLLRQAAADDPSAIRLLFAGAVLLFVLAPLGATLKRWHYHHRREEEGLSPAAPDLLGGCLFNPIFYFCLAAVIFAAVNAFIMQQAFGNREPGGAIFVSSILGGLVLIILHTVLVYRYFSPPRHPPRSAFLRSPVSGWLGDACLFLNMLLFQLIWNLLSFAGLGPPGSALDAVARLLVLAFLALLLYFPPRMFYLAEDGDKARTWAMILLANSPVIVRMVLGAKI